MKRMISPYMVRSRVFLTEERVALAERQFTHVYLINDAEKIFLPSRCPLCHSENFRLEEKNILGIFKRVSLACPTCRAVFKKVADGKYAFTALANQSELVWQMYGNQKLALREW